MYWLIILLVCIIVLTSIITGHEFSYYDEYLFLYFLFVSFFILYIFSEKRCKKIKIQRRKFYDEVNQLSRDLARLYTYIGETNRKLDILKNITLSLPDLSDSKKTVDEILMPVVDVYRLILHSDHFTIRFLDARSAYLRHEIFGSEYRQFTLSNNSLSLEQKVGFSLQNGYFILQSSDACLGVRVYLLIPKEYLRIPIQDTEFAKSLLSYLLLLYTFFENIDKN